MEQHITKTRQMVSAAIFAAVLAVLSQIVLPIGPVPFNLAVLGAYLSGCLMSPIWAVGSVGVYLLMGLIGIPVFAGFSGGPAVFFGPTGGYLAGYLFIALCTSFAVHRSGKISRIFPAMIAGLAICYLLGTGWFMLVTGSGLGESLMLCVIPFILPDLCKAVVALILTRSVKARMSHRT